jgi:hypothetical protein
MRLAPLEPVNGVFHETINLVCLRAKRTSCTCSSLPMNHTTEIVPVDQSRRLRRRN